MPCNQCQNDPRCADRCQAYAELLRQCEASGQMSAAQIHAHEQAGDFAAPVEIGPLTDIHGVVAGEEAATPLPTYHQQEKK